MPLYKFLKQIQMTGREGQSREKAEGRENEKGSMRKRSVSHF